MRKSKYRIFATCIIKWWYLVFSVSQCQFSILLDQLFFMKNTGLCKCKIFHTSNRRCSGEDGAFRVVFPSPRVVAIPRLKSPICLIINTYTWRENSWMYTFPKSISIMWSANCLIQDLNSNSCAHFSWW